MRINYIKSYLYLVKNHLDLIRIRAKDCQLVLMIKKYRKKL